MLQITSTKPQPLTTGVIQSLHSIMNRKEKNYKEID